MRRPAVILICTVAVAGCASNPAEGSDAGGPIVTPPGVDAGPPIPGSDAGPLPPSGAPFTGCEGASPAYATFNAFWTAFDRDYALFDLRLPTESWDDVGRAGCAQMSESITDVGLFDVLIGMARHLDDGHTTLTADALGRDEDAQVSVYAHEDEMDDIESTVEDEYLDDDFATAAEDELSWGTIDGDVGYLSITSMDELSAAGDDEAADVAAAAAAMQQVMNALRGSRAIIVDIRGNGGGWDAVSLEIAAWFAGARTLAWNERVRASADRFDYTEPAPTYVDAMRTGGYAGPVYLLTSGNSFSAAETFALAMRVRDNVTVVGEPTSGHLSDQLDFELPNGWEGTLSHERYYAADGEIYETRGIPVDVEVAFDPAALAASRDNMLERVLTTLGASF
ncbi:MAG: S41 family peptidase [Sandaracinaceae bacterium]